MHSTPKKEKHHADSRIRRRLDTDEKSRKEKYKDTDCESIASISSATPSAAQSASAGGICPLRVLLSNMIEAEERGGKCCLLRRVPLWHTIPLCLLAVINLLLIIVALLGLAGYEITMGIQRVVCEMMRSDLEVEPYVERGSVVDTNSGTLLEY
ncbi:uncharacterized protein EAF01_001618 [Botrytis porri]|uniref:Uncharacterized protein n=1 Tax=Botrytis porri TaxID=87229 RepID=A0A4Z1KZF0_9HELO|nr:uncharacterized protein EAF01_001618 [Botrytis porri]KAF7912597.1 hypothetical protein EAF01_001618 [Botrytis porri]TGO89856.1 hypothetical protein BPOR_0090g00030 [Botrytis porri]